MKIKRGSSQTLSIALLIVGLIIGSGGGYFYVSSTLQPKINDYENQIEHLNTRISTLESENTVYESQVSELDNEKTALEADKEEYLELTATLESENTAYESQVSELDDEIAALEADKEEYLELAATLQIQITESQSELIQAQSSISDLEDDIYELESQISYLQTLSSSYTSTIASMQSEISNLETTLSDVEDIVVTQHYEWEYGTGYSASEWFWDLPISLGTYMEYYFRPRPTDWSDWVDMVKDPDDDYYITSMIQEINAAAINEGFTESEKVNFVIAFVQNLPYTEDDVTTDWNEYPRYPIETLFDRGGDCEDTSILVAALLDRMGYDVCLLLMEDAGHCAVGVAIPGTYGTYYLHDDTQYFFLETTGEGWEIGDFPSSITETSAYVYPINP